MTRCPNCGSLEHWKNDGKCEPTPASRAPRDGELMVLGHTPAPRCPHCTVNGQVNCSEHRTPAPSRLNFAKAYEVAAGWPLTRNLSDWDERYPAALNAQARAYADAAVKAEREDGIWKRAYDNLHGQFQRETLRTSELSALIKRFIDEHHVRGGHPAIRWTKECALCVILADAVALLAKPLNEEARDDHR